MKLFFFASLLCTCYFIGNGQTDFPSVYEIRTDTGYVLSIPQPNWQMLPDKTGKWTINDVIKAPLSNKFFYRNQPTTSDTIVNVYWLRYKIENAMNREAKISLNSMSDYDDFYLQSPDNTWKHFATGSEREASKKDGLKYANYIPLVLKPLESFLVYERLENKTKGFPEHFDLYLAGTETAIQKDYISVLDNKSSQQQPISFTEWELEEAFVLGLLFLAIFLNLFFYRIVREKVYLYFALFALSLSINRLYNISGAYLSWEHSSWLKFVPYIGYAWAFINVFLIQFCRHFLKTKIKYPGWDKWLIALCFLNIISFVGSFFAKLYFITPPAFFHVITRAVSFFIIPLSIAITLLLFLRSRDKSKRYLMIGTLPFMLLEIVTSPDQILNIYKIKLSLFPETIFSNYRLIETISVSWLVLFLTWTLFMRYDSLKKENAKQALDNERLAKEKEIERNELIAKQKTELEIQVTNRTSELKQSLEELKSTQSQLIQSEKMASLGELTAGIAHEIQNPLNFVNNFSEVNTELIDEASQEIDKGNISELKMILNDIKENEQKINHHGKRADGIVKGMLQHSRSSTGVKELTDINALADEYLRLSYHGLRAKDKDFNAELKTDFDNSIGKINIVPQDIGRVLLNLYNNAFYAVNERRKAEGLGYEPTVSVSTKKSGNQVSINVSDNGNGIPQKVVDKIFQPFFTTKPTGQGTGLGLSLSYDIVKAHGGEIKVETKEGGGAAFIIQLPIT